MAWKARARERWAWASLQSMIEESLRSAPEKDSHWIQTFTGKKFHLFHPSVEDVCIEDIAHALSQICRFTGHVIDFYSVAQHSIFVSHKCDPKDALWGLLHDATEAYISDMSSPLKSSIVGIEYKELEKRIMSLVCQKFGLTMPEPESVRLADRRMLMTERRDLLLPLEWSEDNKRAWDVDTEPLEMTITPWLPKQAEQAFLFRWEELRGK